jgi:hypothetical protein
LVCISKLQNRFGADEVFRLDLIEDKGKKYFDAD